MPLVIAVTTRAGRATAWVVTLLAALVAATALTACGSSAPRGSATYGGDAAGSTTALAPAAPVSDLPTIAVSALPPEAVETLRLIKAGGPFPYSRDGVVFGNREGLLPPHPSGWYHEYTVVTPGSSDRGARRIVAGQDGGLFYSDDHYASFHEIVSGGQ